MEGQAYATPSVLTPAAPFYPFYVLLWFELSPRTYVEVLTSSTSEDE